MIKPVVYCMCTQGYAKGVCAVWLWMEITVLSFFGQSRCLFTASLHPGQDIGIKYHDAIFSNDSVLPARFLPLPCSAEER